MDKCPVCKRPAKRTRNYVSVGSVAKIIGLSRSTILRAVEAGFLPGYRTPGGHWRLNLQDTMKAAGAMGWKPADFREAKRASSLVEEAVKKERESCISAVDAHVRNRDVLAE